MSGRKVWESPLSPDEQILLHAGRIEEFLEAAQIDDVPLPEPPEESSTNGQAPVRNWRDRLSISTGAKLAAADSGPVETLPLLGRYGYVPIGFTTALAAYPKVGKTTLLTQCVREWLMLGLRVVVLSEESELLWEYRLSGDEWYGLEVIHAAGAYLVDLRCAVAEADYDVIVIDTVRSVLQLEDETDNSKVRAAVEPWVLIVRERRKTGVLAMHETKSGGEHGRGMAGGHALLGVVDGLLTLRRGAKPDRRVITPLHRLPAEHVDTRELLYTMQATGRLWCVSQMNEDPGRFDRERLVEYVREHPGSGQRHLRDAVGGTAANADGIIVDAVERGLIENRGSSEPRKPRAYYVVGELL
jgi:hypothetical protein